MIQSITATDLKAKLDANENLVLLDVRETHEYDYGHLPNSLHLPLSALQTRFEELQPLQAIVVYCHFGQRSLMAAHWLQQAGFSTLYNLAGGIDAWSRDIDSSIPRY